MHPFVCQRYQRDSGELEFGSDLRDVPKPVTVTSSKFYEDEILIKLSFNAPESDQRKFLLNLSSASGLATIDTGLGSRPNKRGLGQS